MRAYSRRSSNRVSPERGVTARITSALAGLLIALFGATAHGARDDIPVWAIPFAASLCKNPKISSETIATAMYVHGLAEYDMETAHDEEQALDVRISFASDEKLAIVSRLHGSAQQRLRLIFQPARGATEAGFFFQLAPDCTANLARLLYFDAQGRPSRLKHLDANLEVTDEEDLNPPVPAGRDPGGVAVAHVDSGVNYLLPSIANRLARDGDGKLIGQDFSDDDDRPADLDPSRPAFFPIRHGTTVASVLLREAPEARLVPIRHPGRNFDAFADVVTFIANSPARIALMPLGGYRAEDWHAFLEAASSKPELLFILSAGNNGRDIVAEPVYPAAFGLDNAIVVTSSDAFGRIAEGSNWGADLVDLAVPGESIEVIDHRGAKGRASGSSYAAPRVAALAARLLAKNPDWSAAELKAAILELAAPLPRARSPRTRHGWIANPALEARSD